MSSAYENRLFNLAIRLWLRPARPTPHPPLDRALVQTRSILVVKLDGMGDFVLATPFLRELRRLAPSAHITLLTLPSVQALAATCAHVNESLAYAPNVTPRRFGTIHLLCEMRRFVQERLASRSFDLAILPRLHSDMYHGTMLAFMSGAARRVTFTERAGAEKSAENAGYDRFLTDAVPGPSETMPEAEANLELLRFLGGNPRPGPLELSATPDDDSAVDTVLAAQGADPGKPWLALGVGAADPDRIWPAENFLALIREFSRHGWQAFLIGAQNDGDALAAGSAGTVDLCGRLTLRQSYAFLRRARLFVGNDSGPMHLAAAAGCPCVMLCRAGPDAPNHAVNSPARFRPYGVPHRIVRADGAPRGGQPSAAAIPLSRVLVAAQELAGIVSPATGMPA